MVNNPNKISQIGRKIEGLRRIKNISKDTLATKIGMTRQNFAKLEQSGNIDDEKLDLIAEVLGVTADTIKNFNEDAVNNFIQNNYDNTKSPSQYIFEYHYHDSTKLLEVVEENKKLYERMLKLLEDEVEMLKTSLNKK